MVFILFTLIDYLLIHFDFIFLIFDFYAPPQKVAGYYVIPSDILSVSPSVYPSVHPSVSG